MAKKKTGPYRVINPRGLPDGTWIIRDGERDKEGNWSELARYYDGDVYDGPNAEMWQKRGFVVTEAEWKKASDG